MAGIDDFNSNPIVVDLSESADRQITTEPITIKHILISGNVAIGPIEIALRDGDSSGRQVFHFHDARLTSDLQEEFCVPVACPSGLFYENIENRTFEDSNSVMLIYKE